MKTKWKPLRILFIGDEPSSKNKSPDVPFVGTPSYKRLLRWIGELDLKIENVYLRNSQNITSLHVYKLNIDKIIFLGNKSFKNCAKIKEPLLLCSKNTVIDQALVGLSAQLEYVLYTGNRPKYVKPIIYKTIDHPSPRNRNFNKPGYEARMLKDLKRWLYE